LAARRALPVLLGCLGASFLRVIGNQSFLVTGRVAA
jgi:hypothetical protein